MSKEIPPTRYPPHVCLRLKRLRKENKLSQGKVAEYLGMSQQSYSTYENGLSYLNIQQLSELARIYNVSMDYITGASNLR